MSDEPQPDWMKNFVPVPAPPGGRFQKGVSGNPKGRPKGSLSKSDKIARALNEEGLDVVRVVLDAAKGGDMVACGHVLARIAPALRSQTQAVTFDLDPSLPLTSQVEAVLLGISTGRLAPDVGRQIIDAIGTLGNLRAVEDLESRLVILEGKAL